MTALNIGFQKVLTHSCFCLILIHDPLQTDAKAINSRDMETRGLQGESHKLFFHVNVQKTLEGKIRVND